MALIRTKTIAKAKERSSTVTKGGVTYQKVDTAVLAEVATIAKNLAENSSDWAKIDQKDRAVLAAAMQALAEASAALDGKYLSKVHADIAAELITFLKGLVSQGTAQLKGGAEFGNYVKDASGAALYMDNDGLWHCETDFMHVRRKLTAKEVQIEEVTHIGGQQLLTAAQMICAFVVDKGDYYRCFFNKEGSDGRKVTNKWKTGDQAYSCTFNPEEQADGTVGNHYFWRLVTGTSNDGADTSEYEVDGETINGGDYHYIDLSKSVASSGSDEPKPDDNIVQLGYRGTDSGAAERQAAILMAGAGNASPYIREFTGIDSFSLPEPDIQLKPGDNILTGRVKMTSGSMLDGNDLITLIGNIDQKASDAQSDATAAQQTAQAASDSASAASQAATAAGQAAADAADSAEAANQTAETANDNATQAINIANNLSTGNGNLLRNSGFTGDYLPESVAPTSEVDSGTPMYSDPFDHWGHENAEVVVSSDSVTGSAAVLTNGSLQQTLEIGVEAGKPYVFSFKGKGTSLHFSVGGFSEAVNLDSTVQRYNVKFTAASSGTAFAITGSTCTVMELQLIEGNIPFNNWVNHPKDNDKLLAYFQNYNYLLDSIVNGKTQILGGLILSEIIKVGLYRNNQTLAENDETGGMSGHYNSDNSPFIWGGGSMTKAFYTIAKYTENPNYEPTAEELANDMAQFVVTHGGKAILNDIILRGLIYAVGGKIGGFNIGEKELRNNNYQASIYIVNAASSPTQKTIIGEEAVDTMTNEKCSLVAENKRTTNAQNVQPDYNTALFLNAQGAKYNYALHGNGNGVLNGLVFGYRIQRILCARSDSGNTPTLANLNCISIESGATCILYSTTSTTGGHYHIGMPKLSEIRKSLGIIGDATTVAATPFAIEITIIDQIGIGEHEGHVYHRQKNTTLDTSELPWHMSPDNTYFEGGDSVIGIGNGDVQKHLLVYDNQSKDNDGNVIGYRAYDIVIRN